MEKPQRRASIAQWDEDERPRERLMRLGASALSKAELLAILIGSGTANESAVALMGRVLADCGGSLSALSKKSVKELCAYRGIGEAKAVTLAAACEIGKRRQAEMPAERPALTSSRLIYDHVLPQLRDKGQEEFHVLLLNQRLRLIGERCLSRGGLTATVVDVRLVLREALLARATHLAVCHNHPSGNPRPSADDDRLTERLRRAAEAVDIRLVDHLIVTDGQYYSYNDQGRLGL